ncbi:MAG: hypothetical protein WC289_01125 [Patescibacteria group bacterium]
MKIYIQFNRGEFILLTGEKMPAEGTYLFNVINQNQKGEIFVESKGEVKNDGTLHESGQMNLKMRKGLAAFTRLNDGFPEKALTRDLFGSGEYIKGEILNFIRHPKEPEENINSLSNDIRSIIIPVDQLLETLNAEYLAVARNYTTDFMTLFPSSSARGHKIIIEKRLALPYQYCGIDIDLAFRISSSRDTIK